MNQPRRQAYLTLIKTLLTCPSEERTAILQANLELLDEDFAEYLREWATETLPNLDADIAENLANILYNLNLEISSLQQGSHRSNIEIGIACLERGLTIFSREADSEKWAMFQNSLGIAYCSRIKGDRGENIERAIAFFEAALQVRTPEAFPQDWAGTKNNLEIAYRLRIEEDKGEMIERAIASFEEALEVFTRHPFLQDWAMTKNNLANAYSQRSQGDRGDNLEMAISSFEEALEVYTRDAFPRYWAGIQNNLAITYRNRIKGDRGENIERAIKFYQAALEVYTPTTLPLNCLQTGRHLGDLGFAETLWETAIFGYEKAIEAVEQTREWVTSQIHKRQIIEENLNIYEKMMQSCINHQQYHKAVQTVERSKSRYLVELFSNSEIYPKTATETEKQQLQNLRSQIAASQQFLETETPSPPPLSPPLTKGGP
ncbi:tetratricopeptide repeat protein, partial [Microcoleus sp. herbarium2]